MAADYVFVTVGTTSFDELVKASLQPDFAGAAATQGCKRVVLQLGRGATPPELAQLPSMKQSGSAEQPVWDFTVTSRDGQPVHYTCYRFKPSISEDIRGASVVVSHAGAGSIFESLRAGRPLVVAINTSLADNHQQELAQAMADRGHLVYGMPADVPSLLSKLDSTALRPLPALDRNGFLAGLDQALQ